MLKKGVIIILLYDTIFYFITQESTISPSRCRKQSRKKKIDGNQKVSLTKNFKKTPTFKYPRQLSQIKPMIFGGAYELNDVLGFVNSFLKLVILCLFLSSPQLQIENQENAVDCSLLFSLRRFVFGSCICWQAMQRGTEHTWDGFTGIHLEKVLR